MAYVSAVHKITWKGGKINICGFLWKKKKLCKCLIVLLRIQVLLCRVAPNCFACFGRVRSLVSRWFKEFNLFFFLPTFISRCELELIHQSYLSCISLHSYFKSGAYFFFPIPSLLFSPPSLHCPDFQSIMLRSSCDSQSLLIFFFSIFYFYMSSLLPWQQTWLIQSAGSTTAGPCEVGAQRCAKNANITWTGVSDVSSLWSSLWIFCWCCEVTFPRCAHVWTLVRYMCARICVCVCMALHVCVCVLPVDWQS